MTSSSAHSSTFVRRWLSRSSSNAPTNYDSPDVSEESYSHSSFSPPPLTDSSSACDSSTILTPRTPSIGSPTPFKSSRYVASKPSAPPTTRHATLPGPPPRKRAVSFQVPPTPPPVPHALVARTQTQIVLHRLLTYDPMRPALNFDISLPVSFIRQNNPPSAAPSASAVVVRRQWIHPAPRATRPPPPPQPIPQHDLAQFATTPPVTRMKIMTDLIPWSINVRGRTTSPSNDSESFVRVVDVLDGIYQSLRAGVADDEWRRVPKDFRDQVKLAYRRRCAASRPFTITGYEERQGVRRVDYLKDKTILLGLTMMKSAAEGESGSRDSEDGERTWILMLARRPTGS
ncbi:hypothetical protein JB92DRAFT_2888944 [Gautieria morchelliformis]|nr:hypothetical protein JB92DRAFT_2888944 [Gautieria morchelliformis]